MSSNDVLFYNNLPVNRNSKNFIKVPNYKEVFNKNKLTNTLFKEMIGTNEESITDEQFDNIQGNNIKFKKIDNNFFKPIHSSFDTIHFKNNKEDSDNMIMPYSGNTFGSAL